MKIKLIILQIIKINHLNNNIKNKIKLKKSKKKNNKKIIFNKLIN